MEQTLVILMFMGLIFGGVLCLAVVVEWVYGKVQRSLRGYLCLECGRKFSSSRRRTRHKKKAGHGQEADLSWIP